MLRVTLAVLLLSPALCAQLTEKQAVKQLKGDLKAGLKERKQTVGAAVQVFDGNLDATDSLLDSGASIATFAGNVAAFMGLLQEDVRVAIELAYIRAAQGTGLALGALDPAIDLTLGYPEEFVPGSGDLLDDYEADLRKAIEKSYLKLNKRLAKSAKSAEKSGVGFTWRLVPPVDAFGYEAVPGSATMSPSTPVRIDAVVAASVLAEDDDGTLVVQGIANAGAADVTLDIHSGTAGDHVEMAPVTQGTDRWSVTIDDYAGSGGLPEVGYTLVADQEGGGSFTGVPFGVR